MASGRDFSKGFDLEEISEQTIPIDIGEKIDKFEQNKSQNSIFEVFFFGT